MSCSSIEVQKICSFESENSVYAITKAGNNTAWFMDFMSPVMYLYNEMGEAVRKLEVEGSQGVNDMVITPSGDMIVTCSDRTVRLLLQDGQMSTLIETGIFGCYGVCMNDNDEIIVCLNDCGDKNHIGVYSRDGQTKLKEIRGVGDPFRVVLNEQDLCVVDDNTVVCVDKRGDVRWKYDGRQAKRGQFFHPCGICIDKYHCILVTDGSNHHVHLIDKDGGLIQLILTQTQIGLSAHWGICVDNNTGYVWIGSPIKNAVVAKYSV